jgi:hypothetical protein
MQVHASVGWFADESEHTDPEPISVIGASRTDFITDVLLVAIRVPRPRPGAGVPAPVGHAIKLCWGAWIRFCRSGRDAAGASSTVWVGIRLIGITSFVAC